MILQKENVQRIVESEVIANRMLEEGWEEITVESVVKAIEEMSAKELKELATSRGIEFDSKIKKEELIKLLEGEE